ncbi:hypothetical protein RhiirA5_403471 [Rhizophagus irregularis]|uniref:HTH myb-type domain-containing protein n=3 Tax=Rhizophagus irregularis TaxID=588596 RepID=U9TNF7_RHIID|nr:hypothetical protein GLOIN_2v1662697 [Rhizophagus irregularis DAOM 181602=DAOM 197198]EXX77535.1 hypothetical protein RirG_022880 [Rhizophagus irregularis DAOM 197198w]PKB99841.1 hypothetical protein RhiirA5_403471 [Rhizophagus irregularis]PKK66440.1 hypothetical protein RhiirC2_852876 [Rhizophagus irregularis]POG65810.1 hypothetical protein GLOIN_2v1662697 [Rhizophagus irregularis DAOM 181602=DAOM 197198]UZO12029.1 hypothetical protein OCT59_003580 [Rhizophagus irregularis]|eukprot:XP_025172676.1 hypothetical protein GLOIN_2v1662697 [Rhizophagus irregularis DAOM 181602=DAOM 197198]
MRLLSEEERDILLDGMVELRRIGCRNPFVIMAEVLPQFNARQLNNYWRNYLDPELCYYDLDDEEKTYIDGWISQNRIGNGIIEWKNLRQDLKNQYGFLRPENMVKNYWYSKQRRIVGAAGIAGATGMTGIVGATGISGAAGTAEAIVLPPISFILNFPFDPNSPNMCVLPPIHNQHQGGLVLPTLQPYFFKQEEYKFLVRI